jgi:hypothetical protein
MPTDEEMLQMTKIIASRSMSPDQLYWLNLRIRMAVLSLKILKPTGIEKHKLENYVQQLTDVQKQQTIVVSSQTGVQRTYSICQSF